MVISLGAMYAFPDQVRSMVVPALRQAGEYSDLAKFLSKGLAEDGQTNTREKLGSGMFQQAPIVIHTTSGGEKKTLLDAVTYYALGAGACWVGYVVLSQALPEAVQEVLLVTRRFFAKTSSVLAEGIVAVRKSLESKIERLTKKQDDLESKLDDTHTSVKGVQDGLDAARDDLRGLGDGMDRCETAVMNSSRLQSYTSKGVTLLVRCVATMLPSNDRQVNELAQYVRDGEEMGRRESEQRRVAGIRGTPVSMMTAAQLKPQQQRTNLFIRDSELDSSLHSLEDVNAVLGIGPGGVLKA